MRSAIINQNIPIDDSVWKHQYRLELCLFFYKDSYEQEYQKLFREKDKHYQDFYNERSLQEGWPEGFADWQSAWQKHWQSLFLLLADKRFPPALDLFEDLFDQCESSPPSFEESLLGKCALDGLHRLTKKLDDKNPLHQVNALRIIMKMYEKKPKSSPVRDEEKAEYDSLVRRYREQNSYIPSLKDKIQHMVEKGPTPEIRELAQSTITRIEGCIAEDWEKGYGDFGPGEWE